MTSIAAPPKSSEVPLIAALEGDEPELALEQAFAQLASGGSLGLLLTMAKSLVRAGMGGLALRLVQSVRGPLALHPQLVYLLEHWPQLPSGEWSREHVISKLRENAAALSRVDLTLDRHLQAAQASEFSYVVYESARGNRHVIREDDTAPLRFVFPFADLCAHAAAANLPVDSLSASYLMLGVPNHALWRRLIGIEGPGGYKPPIDILETDPGVLGAWLSIVDFDDAISSDRVSFFIGADAVERYREFLLQHPWRDPPTHCTTNFRPGWKPPVVNSRFHSVIRSTRVRHQRIAKLALEVQFAEKDANDWRRPFRAALSKGESQPPRIAGFTNRYSTVIQHAMRGLAAAFERCGCRFNLIMQPNTSCAAIDVTGELLRSPCDLIVVVNHLRSEYASAMPANVPYVCWIQDYMPALWSKDAGRSIGELDLVVGHAPQFMSLLFDYPIDRFIPSSNLTDAGVYALEPVADADRERHACDVSYVSHASGTVESLIDEIVRGSPPAFRKLIGRARDLMVEQLLAKGWLNSTDLVRVMLQAERDVGHSALSPDVRRTRVYPQIARLYDRIFRHQALEWTAHWARTRNRTFKLFGRGWDQHSTLRDFACGEIENGYALRCLHQASLINLQVNGYASLHQRLLDAIASGGFVLSRYNPADFIRPAFVELKKSIEQRELRSMVEIEICRGAAQSFDAQCEVVERLTGIRIATRDDAKRVEHCRIVRESNGVSDWLTDGGLFNALVSMKLAPSRVASDIPAFEQTVFKTQHGLHALLDRFVASKELRESMMLPMRDSVLKHDTFDGLAAKILAYFANGVLE